MINAHFAFVPPGGGETDYSATAQLPGAPNVGDYILLQVGNEIGPRSFIVRRLWWHVKTDANADSGSLDQLTVECEFATGPIMSAEHKKVCENYAPSCTVPAQDNSAF